MRKKIFKRIHLWYALAVKSDVRRAISLELTPKAHAALTEFCKSRGRVRKFVVEQLITWFAEQPPLAQVAIIDALKPADRKAAARLVLEQMAGERSPPLEAPGRQAS